MGKLFIFGIGGTGSRVLKSLTMLLSAGTAINTESIVPIIIDPDNPGGNLTDVVSVMRKYSFIHNKLSFTNADENSFYKTEIKELLNGYKMNVADTQNKKFGEYIDESGMSYRNKALTHMLFSQDNLEADMKVGFKGNPNIGSVVLNQFTNCNDFKTFADEFRKGDRIFIISSIFGGTGASGFPVLVKNLRALSQYVSSDGSSFTNASDIENAPIGAITVLPYFGLKSDAESAVNASTFISKTRAALQYYKNNMTGLDAMYYISDNPQNNYENHDGGAEQLNDAHFIELASALSILDFCNMDVDPENHKPTSYKEFGIKNDSSGAIILDDLYPVTERQIAPPMAKYLLFAQYLATQMERNAPTQPWYINSKLGGNFTTSPFYQQLKSSTKDYVEWLTQLANNKVGFAPFVLDTNIPIFKIIEGRDPKKVFSTKSNYALYDDRLNSAQPKLPGNLSVEARFVELFYYATTKLVREKLNIL